MRALERPANLVSCGETHGISQRKGKFEDNTELTEWFFPSAARKTWGEEKNERGRETIHNRERLMCGAAEGKTSRNSPVLLQIDNTAGKPSITEIVKLKNLI